jgi:hypothetical protein
MHQNTKGPGTTPPWPVLDTILLFRHSFTWFHEVYRLLASLRILVQWLAMRTFCASGFVAVFSVMFF